MRLVPKRYMKISLTFGKFARGLKELTSQKKMVVIVSLLSMAAYLATIFQYYLIARLIGLKIDYVFLLFLVPILIFIEIIPLSISGIGTRDAALVFFLSALGIGAASAISFAFSILVFNYLILLPGLILLFWKPVRETI